MSTAAKILVTVGAIGTVAGIGYAIVSYRRQGESQEQLDDDHEPECEPRDGPKNEPSPSPGKPARSTAQPVIHQPRSDFVLPLPEPKHPRLKARINISTRKSGIVQEEPMDLLRQAMRYDPDIDLNELTGARLIASELGNGTFTEIACIVDTELNRAAARRKSLYHSLTHDNRFGKQGGKRPASTRLDPKMRHLLASRAVIQGAARGVSSGAIRFYDPEAMEVMHRRYRKWVDGGRIGKKPAIVSCDAITLLEAWSFDYGKKGKSRCPPDRTRKGRYTLAWVGPIPGVDPLRLFLMKRMRLGSEHTRLFEAAREVLSKGLGTTGKAG